MAHATIDITRETRTLGDLAGRIITPAFIIGAIGLAAALLLGFFLGGESGHALDRFFQVYLVTFVFFVAVSLGGLFFTLLHHLTRAGWSVVVRRIAEGLATSFIFLAIAFLPLIYALVSDDIDLWPWAQQEVREHDVLVQHKAAYLNTPFFLIRVAAFFAIWIGLGRYFWSRSVKQDQTGDATLSNRMAAVAAPGMLLFAITLTLAAFDWLMSQDPHWFSTIFGVYFFAGAVGSFLGVTILMAAFLQRTGRLTHAITTEHYHDLGKLLFAFGMVFWAYIAFSQYMLIWYGNIPEETMWFQPRASGLREPIEWHWGAAAHQEIVPGAWNGWSTFLLLGHFAVPFLAIISRWPKRIHRMLCLAAGWMVFMCWYDIFWLVMPVFWPGGATAAWSVWGDVPLFPWLEIATFTGLAGLYIGQLTLRLRKVSLVPERDPRLWESLAFENM